MADESLRPDHITLEEDLRSAKFLAGVDEGRWLVLAKVLPDLYVRVRGRDPETKVAFEHDFHLRCDCYPEVGPFVERWDYALNCRPAAPSIGSPGFVDAMKDWGEAAAHGGIYRGWQRFAASHNEWARMRPDQAWRRDREISFIMEELYALVAEQACWLSSRR
jgi:hypothetical protein